MTPDANDDATLTDPPEWAGPSSDPNDEQFGDVVESATLGDADEFKAVFVGEPYDGAVIGRQGAAEGPAAIRESLAATKTHHLGAGPVDSVGDLGDVSLPAEEPSVAAVQEHVRAVADPVYDAAGDAVPVFLGGDNSLTFANAAPLLDRGTVGALSFDAHLDCREVPDEGPTSGTPYRQLHDAGLDSFAVVGARDFETSTAYVEYVRDQGGTVTSAAEVGAAPIDAVEDALRSLGPVDHLYVSVDVDVLDAAAAPGVSAPTPGGLSTRELYRLLARVASEDRVAGLEVVECAPPLDEGGRTVDAAARAVANALAGAQSGGQFDRDELGGYEYV